MADLLWVFEALEAQTARIRRLRKPVKSGPVHPVEHRPRVPKVGAAEVVRLLRAVEEKALQLEESASTLPAARRPVDDSLAEVCRQMATRLRGLLE